MINGYKCFNEGLINQYGLKFEPNTIYHEDRDVKFHHGGFHMCTNLEDTLRYFDAMNNKVDIAKVTGFGKIDKYNDEYNEYFDMYATEYMIIDYVLTREEIINYSLGLSHMGLKRFVSSYKLTEEEIELFLQRYSRDSVIRDAIEYYQKGNNKVYIKKKY